MNHIIRHSCLRSRSLLSPCAVQSRNSWSRPSHLRPRSRRSQPPDASRTTDPGLVAQASPTKPTSRSLSYNNGSPSKSIGSGSYAQAYVRRLNASKADRSMSPESGRQQHVHGNLRLPRRLPRL